MEVFTKYFRRLIVNNASQIWGPNRNTEPSGNYPILVSELQKVTHDPHQAGKIVESIETGDGEIFKDFDLSTFMEHFRMDSVQKITLASAFQKSAKSDLRTKGMAFLHIPENQGINVNTSGCNNLEQHSKLYSCRLDDSKRCRSG